MALFFHYVQRIQRNSAYYRFKSYHTNLRISCAKSPFARLLQLPWFEIKLTHFGLITRKVAFRRELCGIFFYVFKYLCCLVGRKYCRKSHHFVCTSAAVKLNANSISKLMLFQFIYFAYVSTVCEPIRSEGLKIFLAKIGINHGRNELNRWLIFCWIWTSDVNALS